jgi:hypothetical protein
MFFIPLLLFFLFSVSPDAQAKEKEQPITRSPSPQSAVTSAYVGERTPINLSLRGRVEDPVTIFIRTPPRFGLLSAPERVNRKTWRVWYSSRPDSAENLDSFTYAAKSVDSPVSVAAQVQVSIIKRAAELVFSDSLDFGSVSVGDTLIKEVTVSNSGGKTAIISPAPRAPWKLVDATPIQIPGGETKKIRVAFSPDASGLFAEKLVLEPDSKRGVTLNGSSENPLQWTHEGILFAAEKRSNPHTSVSFTNHTDEPRPLVFQWPDFFEAPSHVSIDADSSMEIPISLKAPPSFSWSGSVPFSSGNFSGSITIAVQSAPPHVELKPTTILDLGEVPLGVPAQGTLVLTNSGGRPIRLSIEVPKGVKLTPSPTGILLNPSSNATFQAIVAPSKAGTSDFLLPVHSDSESFGAFGIRVSARPAQPVEKLLTFQQPSYISKDSKSPLANIPAVEECFLADSTEHSVTISWKLNSPDTKGFIIERRETKAGTDGQVNVSWKRWEGVDVEISGDTAKACFRKLPSGTFWNIRITGFDSNGLPGQPAKGHFRIETKPEKPLLPTWAWALIALAAATAGLWFFKKKITFVKDDVDARIASLEK